MSRRPAPGRSPAQEADAAFDEEGRPSKSQRKRESHALQTLGDDLAALPASRLNALELPESLREAMEFRRAIGGRVYGCDDCLDACPWNRFAKESREASFRAREAVFSHRLRDFLELDDDGFRSLFARSPIKRIKRARFLRNVCVALGNVGTLDDLSALERACNDPDPLVSSHASWARDRILERQGG